MGMPNGLLAVASMGSRGLDDEVSQVFARCPVFTIVQFEREGIRNVKIEVNRAAKLPHGVGPMVSYRLIDMGVVAVIAGGFGPTVLEILKRSNVEAITVPAGTVIREAVERYLKQQG